MNRTRIRTSNEPHEPPHGCTWGHYVELLVEASGGWTPLVDLLIHRAKGTASLPEDPQSIERGLRRLAGRDCGPGGQYGRWLLKFFGVPASLADQARWMGQYHSRFSDLPRALCESQLLLWDRPPICESDQAAWIHLGLATVAMRKKDEPALLQRLASAKKRAPACGPSAEVETTLLEARLASGEDERKAELLAHAMTRLRKIENEDDRHCYLARCLDQQAYVLLHPADGPKDLNEARALYQQIPSDCKLPFVRFRRSHGLAYCAWKLGEAKARAMAEDALAHAGDGGFVRFRVMALELFAHIALGEGDKAGAERMRLRAHTMVTQLQHEDLSAISRPCVVSPKPAPGDSTKSRNGAR